MTAGWSGFWKNRRRRCGSCCHRTRKHETAADFTYSSGKLDQVLADLSCFDPQQAVPPKDAYVEDDGSAFVVIPEQEGTTLDPEKTRQAVREAVESGAAVLDLKKKLFILNRRSGARTRNSRRKPSF